MNTVPGNGLFYDDGSLASFRSLLNQYGVVCGVAYLGYVEDWSAVRYDFFMEEGWIYTQTYPFLTAIDMSHWVSNDGHELYAIVPADPNATVQIYDCFMGEKGNLLYQSNTGAPIQPELRDHGQPRPECGLGPSAQWNGRESGHAGQCQRHL